jgi:putative redox protein
VDLHINFDSQRTQPKMLAPGRVVVAETGNNQHQQLLLMGRHALVADQSKENGGDDTGPDPRGLMMMALGSHLSMTLRGFADRRGWAVDQILVYFDDPCRQSDELRSNHRAYDRRINCAVELVGELDDQQRSRLVQIANQHIADWYLLMSAR